MDSGLLLFATAAAGSGGVLTYFLQQVVSWFRGRQQAESRAWEQRDKAISQRDRAYECRDIEAKARRILEEYAHRLRRQIYQCGKTPEDWPDYRTTKTRDGG